MYNPSILSAAALVGVAATQVAALKVANNAIVEFRYCPPTKNSVERMQACVAQSRDSSLGAYSANSTAALYCETVQLLKDPIVTVLSTVLSEVHYPGDAVIGNDNSARCGESGPDPWTVVVNGSVSPNRILESWSKYDEELYALPEGAYVHPPAGSVPRVFPWMFCNLPIGVDYEQQCQDTLKFLWTPLGALEILFPWQFSQYCFLCWWWGTLMFDVVHWLLHKFSKSKSKLLRRIGRLHMVHHFYFDTTLTFNDKYAWHNSWVELPWEGVCLYTGSLISWYICKYFDLTDKPWGFTEDIFRKIVFTQACKTIYTMYYEGKDANHLTWPVVPKDPDFWMVGAEYHCLHHVQPDAYYSSLHRFFDQAIGASTSYKQKRITITGAGGAYGQALIKQLKGQKIRSLQVLTYGKDWTHNDFSGAIPKLVDTDVLILAHGTKGEDAMQANCDSAVKFIELFKKHRKQRDTWLPGRDGAKEKRLNSQMLPEVWYTGSEIEIIKASPKDIEMQRYSASKRAFARYARAYYDDTTFIYRHIVPAGFTSAMGKGLVSADWAASVTMFFILRGARYVPVTYTTMAYWNFFKFLYNTKPLKVGDEGAIKAVL